jgi:hypothetical protein
MFSFNHGGAGFDHYDEDDDDYNGLRHETLESRATFRILAPKKKGRKGLKGALMNQPESGSASEAENTFETDFPNELRQFITKITTTPAKAPDDLSYFDSNPTPTQARLDDSDTFPALGANIVPPSRNILANDNSDQKTKDKDAAAILRTMSHITQVFETTKEGTSGDDAFDSLDWDPDLPSAPRSESPEEVPIKPQPVTYTTVGSLVNPNVKPQFSAPRRIQREGAGRTPLTSMLQGARFQPYFRGPPPSLNQSNSMAYAQHIGRSPNSVQSFFSQSSRSTPSKEQIQMTEVEKEILRAVHGRQDTQMMPGEFISSGGTSTPSSVIR